MKENDDTRSYSSSSSSQKRFREEGDGNDSCDNLDDVVDFLPEVEDQDNEEEDKGMLDDQAIANLKAQEEDNLGVTCFEEIDFHPDEPRPAG
jgi:hypothetical protein